MFRTGVGCGGLRTCCSGFFLAFFGRFRLFFLIIFVVVVFIGLHVQNVVQFSSGTLSTTTTSKVSRNLRVSVSSMLRVLLDDIFDL